MYIKRAIEEYTKAINVPDLDSKLCSVCYANRAQAQLLLKNYGYVISDCKHALRLDSTNVKAMYRGAKAALMLRKFKVAREFCKKGLDLKEKELIADKDVKILEGVLKTIQMEERKDVEGNVEKAKRERSKANEEGRLKKLLENRGVTLGLPLFGQQRKYGNVKAMEFEDGSLIWPLMVVYPEGVNEGLEIQSDYVEEVHEDTLLGDIVDMLWPEGQPGPGWDVGRIYNRGKDKLRILYRRDWTWKVNQVEEERRETDVGSERGPEEVGKWISVDMSESLGQLLAREDYVTPLFPVIYLVPQGFSPR